MNDMGAIPGAGLRQLLDDNPRIGEAKRGPRRFWTNAEERIIREHYPDKGVAGCVPLLPGRSAATIYQKAAKLGVRFVDASGFERQRRTWTFTPQMDDAIRRAYQSEPDIKALKRLAITMMRPYSAVRGRALKLGLVLPRFSATPWSEAEMDVLRDNWMSHPGTIRRKLRALGYARTVTAILLQRKRFGRRTEDDSGALGAAEAADVFGVSRDTVGRWLDRGWLRGERVKSHAAPEHAKPHDKAHYRITRADLKSFIVENVGIVDFHKVDKFWLVELLADTSVRTHARRG